MTVHYQTWTTDRPRALCNDSLMWPCTSIHIEEVTCKRCLKMEPKYRGEYKKKDSKGWGLFSARSMRKALRLFD